MADPVRITLSIQEPPLAGAESPGVRGSAPDLTLLPGQMVRGLVTFVVLQDVEFREAQVRFLWHTEGKGNRVTGEGGTESLARGGRWLAGSTHEFSFELPAPGGPLSYRGRILKVAWEIQARLDRSLLKPDIVESFPVVLEGTPDPDRTSLGPVPQERDKLEAVKKGRVGTWVAVGSLFMLMGLAFGASRGWELDAGGKWTTILLVGGGLFITLRGFWGRLGRGKLGEPTVHLSTTEVRRGEEIRFSVIIRPEQRAEIRSLEVILECEERVVHGHGQYQSRHKRTVFEKRITLAEDLVIEPHRGLKKKGFLTIPPDIGPSFGAPYNQLIWWLKFRGDIVGWPDWREPVLLTVWP